MTADGLVQWMAAQAEKRCRRCARVLEPEESGWCGDCAAEHAEAEARGRKRPPVRHWDPVREVDLDEYEANPMGVIL